jgi:RNA polymerase sigma-70 factor (ECF subfamily)
MTVGQKRNSRSAGTEPPAVRDEDKQPGMVAVDDLALDDLLPRVARGDTEAFATVCDQVSGAVYGLVRRVVGDQAQTEQVTADVLLEVWRSASRFSPAEGSGLEWVMTMARREARRRSSGPAGVSAAGMAAAEELVAGMAAAPAAGNLLAHRGLAALPGPQREAVLLASCGYTWRQVADLLGIPAEIAAERLRAGLLSLGSGPKQRPSSMASSARAEKFRETED